MSENVLCHSVKKRMFIVLLTYNAGSILETADQIGEHS